MKIKLKWFVNIFISLLIINPTVYAFALQQDGYEEKTIVMEEIIVSATKTPEKRKDIPNAVIIMDKTDMQASGAKTIGELLANEPGIDWQTYGNYAAAPQEIHIRGMKGNATQIFINGACINSPSLGIADVGKVPIDNIERIEVVKGTGSLLYGSGAMGGVVNIITRRPERGKMDMDIVAGYGSQNSYRLSAEQGLFITNDFGYYLTAGRTETDGFRDNSHLRQSDVSVNLVLDRRDVIGISLYGNYIDRKYGLPGVMPPDGTKAYYIGSEKFYNSDSASLLNKGGDKDGNIVLEVKGKTSEWLGYDLKGHFSNMENSNYARWPSFGTASGSESWVTNQVVGTDGHIDIYPFEGAKLLVGGEYKDFIWKNEAFALNAVGTHTVETTDKAHIFTKGVFTEAEYRPSRYWKAMAGFRQENNSAFGSENLTLFGFIINPFETTALKVNHGKHFLAPTPNALYWPADIYSKGNPDLKPEIGWHTDATLEQSLLEDKIFMSVSYFHWNVDDKIQWEPDSQGIFSPINLAGYMADGIEVGTRIGPFYDFTLDLSYTYTDAKEENREYTKQDYGWPPLLPPDFQYSMVKRRATMTPDHQFKGNLTYKSNFGMTLAGTARYVGDQVMYNTETTAYPNTRTVTYILGSYWTADIKIEQRFYKNWILSLSGKNLFDKNYITRLESFTDQNTFKTSMCGYPGAGRSIFTSLAYEF